MYRSVKKTIRAMGALIASLGFLAVSQTAEASAVYSQIGRVHVYEDGKIEVMPMDGGTYGDLCPDEATTESWGTVLPGTAAYDALLKIFIAAKLSGNLVRFNTEQRGSDCIITMAALWQRSGSGSTTE